MNKPKLVIHGGAGSLEGNLYNYSNVRNSLKEICFSLYGELQKKNSIETVLSGVCALEDNPLFNAGTGSKLQNDGQIRMSASFMDSLKNNFSSVINIQNVKNPILVAYSLQNNKYTNISGRLATEYARKSGFKSHNPYTTKRITEYQNNIKGQKGTVGVVALDKYKNLASGTSTGGIGGELPGRVSDSATIAGNYANKYAGVSVTGIGEHIINAGVAVKICTYLELGMDLKSAVKKIIQNAKKNNYKFGLISISKDGDIVVDKTTDEIFYASYDGIKLNLF
ncbi:MAG: isoaspartyl peptidase/L-asparaginase [Candidatus Neomarinimicrobiota bacterium]|nr:isoaspartyl peptidase/L-asparaginase [Candidatus Neomarinimicrobiota bacterium]